MKIVFMGTPEFAASALRAIVEAGYDVAAVVTQPDKPKGRSHQPQMSAVKVYALEQSIPVFQPVKVREAEAVEQLRRYGADLFIVAAFGQILTEEILNMPRLGCVNIHASLLPKYRGAAPIQWVIINGEKETGITLMKMDRGIDTGEMLLKSVVLIGEKETGASLHDKLAEAGAKLIVQALPQIEAGELVPEKQDDTLASYVSVLNKALGHIDWSQNAVTIERLIRGLNSWPSAYTYYNRKVMKIWEAEIISGDSEYEPGCITQVQKDSFDVQTGEGILRITVMQLEGKKKMAVRDFLLGGQITAGTMLL